MSETTRTIVTRIQNKYDTALEWTINNPILLTGEVGYESDTGKFKIGDGNLAWVDLNYAATLPTEVEDYIKYSNDTPIVSALGSIKPGQTFENVSIKDMLTMILYPYIDIEVGTLESTKDKQPSVNAAPGKYYVHTTPTLNSVTLYVKKNSATNLIFNLWDRTNNRLISNTLTATDIVDNKLVFADLNIIVDTTREFEIRYSYKGEENIISKTFSIGTFTISFLNPSIPTITSNLTSLDYYEGQTISIGNITTNVVELNSAALTGGITKINLYKNDILVSSSEDNPILPYNFYMSEQLTEDTTYKVETCYNTRTGDSTATTGTSQSNSFKVDFTHRDAVVTLTGINSNNSISKLESQSISVGSLGVEFWKYSDKITSINLLANNNIVETKSIDDFAEDKYSEIQGTTTFIDYTAHNICSNLTLSAEAYNENDKVASSNSIELQFYAPYCYGFVNGDEKKGTVVTFDTVDMNTLMSLSNKQKDAYTHIVVDKANREAGTKFIYAVPLVEGTNAVYRPPYKSAKDSNGMGDECFSAFENSDVNTIKEITFADGSKVSYQILIEATKGSDAIDLTFE